MTLQARWARITHPWRIGFWALLLVGTAWLINREPSGDHSRLPLNVRCLADIVHRRANGHNSKLDVYLREPKDTRLPQPAAIEPLRPVILAFHGGGWTGGDKSEYGRWFLSFVDHGYIVVAVDYTLSHSGAPAWPACLEDARASVDWVKSHASEIGADPNRIVALGSSAGGHLAALLGTDRISGAGRAGDRTFSPVQAVVDFYGPSDLVSLERDSAGAAVSVRMLLGVPAELLPKVAAAASPIRRVTASSAPMLLIHGADDQLVPPSQSRSLAAELAKAGVYNQLVIVPGARHGFGLGFQGRDFLPSILAFLDRIWNDELSGHESQAFQKRTQSGLLTFLDAKRDLSIRSRSLSSLDTIDEKTRLVRPDKNQQTSRPLLSSRMILPNQPRSSNKSSDEIGLEFGRVVPMIAVGGIGLRILDPSYPHE